MNDITYTVSTSAQDRHQKKEDIGKIVWQEKNGTVSTLVEDIKTGLAYCANFVHNGATFNKGRTKKNFKNTYLITFDFDAVCTTARDFYFAMAGTEIPPTIVYTTANNGTFKDGKNESFSNRYRVIYVLDEPIISRDEYQATHQFLKDEISGVIGDNGYGKSIEERLSIGSIYIDDSDSGQAERFYYGNTDAEIYSDLETITPLTWLLDRCGISSQEYHDVTSSIDANKAFAYRMNNISELDKKVDCVDIRENNTSYYPPQSPKMTNFIYDYLHTKKTFQQLTSEYHRELPLLPEETPVKTNSNKLYAEVSDSHISILRKRHKVSKRGVSGNEIEMWQPIRFRDGQGRRRKLYLYLQMVKAITPSATMEQLVWNGVHFITEQVDNSNDPITKDDLTKIVEGVLERVWMPSEKSRLKYRKKIKTNSELARKRGIPMNRAGLAAAHEWKTDKKNEKWAMMESLFDSTKTDKENVEIMRNSGIDITVDYLKDWRRKTGKTKSKVKAKGDMMAQYFDPSMTDKENVKRLADMGLKIGLKTFRRWKEANGYTKPMKGKCKT